MPLRKLNDPDPLPEGIEWSSPSGGARNKPPDPAYWRRLLRIGGEGDQEENEG